MSTFPLLRQRTGYAVRKTLVAAVLGLLGLVVGASCVILPTSAPFGVIGLGVALLFWMMPELRFVPIKFTRAALAPFLIAFLCVPAFYAIILPGVPWISVRRVFLFALVLPFAVVMCGSSQSRAFIADSFKRCKLILLLLVCFFVVDLTSTPLGTQPSISLSANVFWILNYFIPMIAIVFVVRDEYLFIRVYKLFVICVGVNLVAGGTESYLKRPFLAYLLPAYMRDQIIADNPLAIKGLVTGVAMRGGLYRASSTFSTSLSWGEVSAMLAPICLHFLMHRKSTADRLFGSVGLMMCFVSVVLSGSRGAYIAILVSTFSYTLVWSFWYVRTRPESLIGAIWLTLFSMASGTVLLAVFFVGAVRKKVLGGGETQSSSDVRLEQWALAKPKILARPILGYGSNTAPGVVDYVLPGGDVTLDGYYMNLLVDYGIPGFALFFGIFIAAIYVCFETYIRSTAKSATYGAAMGSSILSFAVYRFTLSQPDSLTLAFSLVGLTIAYRRMTQEDGSASVKRNLSRPVEWQEFPAFEGRQT